MADNPNLVRAHDLAAEITEQNARLRELLARSIEVLKLLKPDTFLGRRTHEPSAMEARTTRGHLRR
ncbi:MULTISPECIES: hypothetical protein [Bradyrhizobium]|uniref:hypothetical protein n=1 Tax=Bradyrhizobium TaxID=374 RepID=UPI0004046C07|nr:MULTISPECIES: hypothetical protein [Bradyrhizobium]QOG23036.1 hypothetical protein FOM02_43070 [Bradyrhizobium sp. SEMIA]UFW50550.1 hypothetical protein BaraCB756_05725 [Bradyrhizobium arachidis]